MPFDFIENVTGLEKVRRPSISYQRNTTKAAAKAGDRKPKLLIALPVRLAHEFKHKKGQHYRLALGKGDDAGKARVSPAKADAAGAIEPTVFKHGLVFRFGHIPLLGENAAAKEYVDGCVITGAPANSLEIVLPPWFKPD